MELLLAALTILISLLLAAQQKRPEPKRATVPVFVRSKHHRTTQD